MRNRGATIFIAKFSHFFYESTLPTNGFRMKVKARSASENQEGELEFLPASQERPHPPPRREFGRIEKASQTVTNQTELSRREPGFQRIDEITKTALRRPTAAVEKQTVAVSTNLSPDRRRFGTEILSEARNQCFPVQTGPLRVISAGTGPAPVFRGCAGGAARTRPRKRIRSCGSAWMD
jgi:hypothetical protein